MKGRRAPGGRDEEFGAGACWTGPVEEGKMERWMAYRRRMSCSGMERCWVVALGT